MNIYEVWVESTEDDSTAKKRVGVYSTVTRASFAVIDRLAYELKEIRKVYDYSAIDINLTFEDAEIKVIDSSVGARIYIEDVLVND